MAFMDAPPGTLLERLDTNKMVAVRAVDGRLRACGWISNDGRWGWLADDGSVRGHMAAFRLDLTKPVLKAMSALEGLSGADYKIANIINGLFLNGNWVGWLGHVSAGHVILQVSAACGVDRRLLVGALMPTAVMAASKMGIEHHAVTAKALSVLRRWGTAGGASASDVAQQEAAVHAIPHGPDDNYLLSLRSVLGIPAGNPVVRVSDAITNTVLWPGKTWMRLLSAAKIRHVIRPTDLMVAVFFLRGAILDAVDGA